MKNYWIYIPIETKVRELYGKILLASFATANGFNVVIGSKKDINSNISFFPRGIIFNFRLAKNFAKNYKRYKSYGHKVAAIDEEGLVTLKDELYIKYRVSEETLDTTDMFFCWGKKQASLIESEFKKNNCKIFITGNSRFDVLRPEFKSIFSDDIKKIKEKYGKIILINTNFGYANHFSGEQSAFHSLRKKGWMNNPEDEKYFFRRMEWQKFIYNKFLELIPLLSERFRDYNIIIRPHPSENHENWKKIEENFSNVFVVHLGNVISWIMSADVLIHNGCTTAIEAYLLGTAIISYRPLIVEDVESELPNKLSIECYQREEVFDSLNNILFGKNNFKSDKNKVDLGYHLSGFNEKTASEQIVDILSNYKISSRNQKINKLKFYIFNYLSFLKNIISKFINKEKNLESLNYLFHKTPDITITDISKIIKKLSKINKDFSNIKIEHINGTCFRLFRE